ncbi:hypothetical protein RhiJN_14766 [Ceratobasidium sp. AG-Ba]|nr:hypothetical protein RhiJN_14766 [Ceratobasidium sp. AG-Ba]QRW15303.1 hypothetical protein RhiLY_14302 [Ceratobasidium sp. AG-Ba]
MSKKSGSKNSSQAASSKARQQKAEKAASAHAKRVKLKPQRPVPTVHPASNVTGPRSSHVEGKNVICVTRATKLASYLRRCKSLVLDDGFKTLHLYALGAAIPHLLLLVTSLPECLPFGTEEIRNEILTGTTTCIDEIHPEDEDEDIETRSRNKSSLQVKIIIGDGIGGPGVTNKKS